MKKDNQIVVPENPDKRIFGEIIGQREGDNIYILTKVFQEFCQEHGFEVKLLIKELIKHNILIPYNYNLPRKMKKSQEQLYLPTTSYSQNKGIGGSSLRYLSQRYLGIYLTPRLRYQKVLKNQ